MSVLATLRRYVRAFVTAVRMTARGEQTAQQKAAARYPRWRAWCAETVRQTDELVARAEAAAIDVQARKNLTLHLEGRDISLDAALAGVRFHAAQEYPHLLRDNTGFALLAIQSTNMNDRFTIGQFAGAAGMFPPLADELRALNEHLSNPPVDEQ